MKASFKIAKAYNVGQDGCFCCCPALFDPTPETAATAAMSKAKAKAKSPPVPDGTYDLMEVAEEMHDTMMMLSTSMEQVQIRKDDQETLSTGRVPVHNVSSHSSKGQSATF